MTSLILISNLLCLSQLFLWLISKSFRIDVLPRRNPSRLPLTWAGSLISSILGRMWCVFLEYVFCTSLVRCCSFFKDFSCTEYFVRKAAPPHDPSLPPRDSASPHPISPLPRPPTPIGRRRLRAVDLLGSYCTHDTRSHRTYYAGLASGSGPVKAITPRYCCVCCLSDRTFVRSRPHGTVPGRHVRWIRVSSG